MIFVVGVVVVVVVVAAAVVVVVITINIIQTIDVVVPI